MKRRMRLRALTVLVGSLLLVTFLTGGVTHADGGGGVGSGGSGGGSGAGHYTWYNFGWIVYNVNGAGPSAGFRAGTWGSAQAACKGYSTDVAVFTIDDANHTQMGYNYDSVDATYGTGNYLAGGTSPGGVSYTDIGTIQANYNKLPASIRSGFTFGVNVSWFCYGIIPSTPPPNNTATLDGRKVDTTGATKAVLTNTVSVTGSGSDASNPFYFYGGAGNGSKISMGTATNTTRTVSVAAPPAGWVLVGHSIWDATASPPPYTASAATSFNYNFKAGHAYHMRWVYKYFAPGTFAVTASVGGSGFNDTENPVNFRPVGAATVTFTYPNGASVAANVTLDYTAQYSILPAGSITEVPYPAPLTCSPSGGRITVTSRLVSGGVTGSVPSNCTASEPPLAAGDRACVTYTFTPQSGTVDAITGGLSNLNMTPVSTHHCFPALINKPYVHFFGLDVSAGGTFANGLGDQCSGGSTTTSGSIQTLLKTGAPLVPASGSSGQFAAFANGSGTINQYSSASLRTSTPTSSNGLSFANTGPIGALGVNHCVPDYFATKSASTPTVNSASVDLASLDGNGNSAVAEQSAYTAPGGLTLKGFNGNGSGIASGHRVAIYVTGDVYIQNDIKFKQSSWASVDQIPSFYLIVKGNIYIDPSVTQLDGVYVAQPNGATGGTISTCAPGLGLYGAAQLYNSCQKQLTVNGAFIANTVNLLRTANSLRNSMGGEQPTSPVGNCATNARVSAAYDCAAEIFNFSPEIYLGHPGFDPNAGPALGKYDYITSLSPVL